MSYTDKEFELRLYGGYEEVWSDTYLLNIRYYDNKKLLIHRGPDGAFCPVSGDADVLKDWSDGNNSFLHRYVQETGEAYDLIDDYLKNDVPFERLSECWDRFTGGAIFSAELIRILMDEHKMKLETASAIASLFFRDTLSGTEESDLLIVQPRTAHVLMLLKKRMKEIPVLIHDTRDAGFRSPFGSVKTQETVTLTVREMGSICEEIICVLAEGENRRQFSMKRTGNEFSLSIRMPETAVACTYHFSIKTKAGEKYWLNASPNGFLGAVEKTEGKGFRLTVYRSDFETPQWFQNSILYQIFPDRFAFSNDNTAEKGIAYHLSLGQKPELHASLTEPVRSKPRKGEDSYYPDDFYGGTLKGIQKKIPYLKDLGVTCIYLNPVVEARSNHRYDTSDYTCVDPILGTNDDFISLCREAEENGIRILTDGVFSHTGADSIYFNRDGHYPGKGAYQDIESSYYDWYQFLSYPNDYKCWWGFRELPEVDENIRTWQDYIVTGENSIVRRWLRMGSSGWRIDVADEIPDDVLTLIREASKKEKPDAVILGEVWEDAVIKQSYGSARNYALGNSLDSVMNYPLRTAVLDFIHGRIDAFALRDFLLGQRMNYPEPLYRSLMNLLGSHDVERLLSALATDVKFKELERQRQLDLEAGLTEKELEKAVQREKLCSSLVFMLPGVPSIYYGDEQGMRGSNDPFNRAPFQENDQELFAHYQKLCRFRSETPVLQSGEVFFEACGRDVIAILRYSKENEKAVLLLVNRSQNRKKYCLSLPQKRKAEGEIEGSSCLIHEC